MSEKYLIFGATGSIGSSLAEQLKGSGHDIHLVARNEGELSVIASKLGCSFTVVDVLENNFIEKVKADVPDIKGIAYCVGSIDLKPLRMVKEEDFNKCMKLNLYSAVEAIKGYQESLKKNKGSIVLFSTVAAQRGFTNQAIIAAFIRIVQIGLIKNERHAQSCASARHRTEPQAPAGPAAR